MWETALYLWKLSQLRNNNSFTDKVIRSDRRYKGTWKRPYMIGDIPEPNEGALLTKASNGECYVFGGLIGSDLEASNAIYRIHTEEEVWMSIFSACRCRGHHKDRLSEKDETKALKKLFEAQIQMSIDKVGKFLVRRENGIVANDNQQSDGTISSGMSSMRFTSHSKTFGVCYFKIEVLTIGNDNMAAIGLSASEYEIDLHLPGGEHSFAYHGADGRFYADGQGQQYGPRYRTGDVVGCGIILKTHEVFFTKNGQFLGVAFKYDPEEFDKPFHATVGMAAKSSVSVNFGATPFIWNFEVPTIKLTKVATISKVGMGFGCEFVRDKIYYFHTDLNYVIQWDPITKKISKIANANEPPTSLYDLGYDHSAVNGSDIWMLLSYPEEQSIEGIVRVYPNIDTLSFAILHTDSCTYEKKVVRVSSDFSDMRSPVSLFNTVFDLPVVNDQMFFFSAYPPFYLDLKTFEVHPIRFPKTFRALTFFASKVFKDKVTNKEMIALFGGSYPPSNNHEDWTNVRNEMFEDLDAMNRSILIFDPETHSMIRCPYGGAITPHSKAFPGLLAVDESTFCVFGGFVNDSFLTNSIEFFTFSNDALLEDPLVASFDNKELYDIKIVATKDPQLQHNVIYANKVILHSRCGYFRSILKQDTSVLEINESYEMLYHLIRYLYSDRVSQSLRRESYLDFLTFCEKLAPEHLERITSALLLTYHEGSSLMSSQMRAGFTSLYSDLELAVQNKNCYVHKAVICSRSDYFRAMCYSGMKESGKKRLEMHDMEYEPFRKCIRYLYSNSIESDDHVEDDIVEVLKTARLFGIESMVRSLEDILCRNITEENVAQLRQLAEELDLKKLMDSCSHHTNVSVPLLKRVFRMFSVSH
eukprot:TRINITY_DN2584_c0_g1_i1.p1 TRINITY_DN2584_c0_g1~~TRINITY_DN2584_c0_g1_i1.p1  ORF type:complete len:905 (-),score=196.48 TRINITY_DN2584_c0_g1_i1:78-2684(-)